MPEFINPAEVLKKIDLKADMIAADFGCGSGGWVIPLSRRLEKGAVYAIDVQPTALSALEGRLRLQGITNIKKVLADVECPIDELADESCDFVLVTDLLFQAEEKDEVFKEAKRVLKPAGRLLVVEWIESSPLGPKQGRVSPDRVKQIAQRFNFALIKDFQAGDYHFALVFQKKD